eukprot:COSAG03_NODE_16927_length_388_cov_0.840830_1_plen_76_part_01
MTERQRDTRKVPLRPLCSRGPACSEPPQVPTQTAHTSGRSDSLSAREQDNGEDEREGGRETERERERERESGGRER